jgi:hypothetical protein
MNLAKEEENENATSNSNKNQIINRHSLLLQKVNLPFAELFEF